jgi:hypothetical protein
MPWLLSPTNAIDDLKIGLYGEPEQPICTAALVIRTFKHSRLSIEDLFYAQAVEWRGEG